MDMLSSVSAVVRPAERKKGVTARPPASSEAPPSAKSKTGKRDSVTPKGFT